MNRNHLLFSILYILCLASCKNDMPTQTTGDTSQNNEATIRAALQTVQDSLQLDETAFERVNDIMIRYENETKEIQTQKFNNPKTKQQVMQNLLKSRRTELSDVLKPREMMAFNKLYKQSLADERKRKREEKQLSEEDRKALGEQIREYRKSVAPGLIEQRRTLEASMTSADKAQIAGLREKTKSFNQSIKDKKTACAAIDQKDRKAKTACRRELRALQKTQEPIKKEFDELISLLEEKPGTQAIMNTMNTQRDIWRADLKKILDSYSENEIDVDKIPLNKYLRLASPMAFLLANPKNLNESEIEKIDDEN